MRVSRVIGGATAATLALGFAPTAAWAASTSLRYSFDSGYGLRVVGDRAAVSLVAHGGGRAVQFPARAGRRVILEGGADSRLNPGSRQFRWGATVRLRATETGAGE